MQCKSPQLAIHEIDQEPTRSSTYLYMGTSFSTKHESKIDTTNYSWTDEFVNGKLMKRTYPNYENSYIRTEDYWYNKNGEIEWILSQSIYPNGQEIWKKTSFNKIDSVTTEKVFYTKSSYSKSEIIRTVKDTSFIDVLVNQEIGFTKREYWDSAHRKHSQIVRPKQSTITNISVYNENMDLTAIYRVLKGQDPEQTMRIEYIYDNKNRVIMKDTYAGNELSSKEITIYHE